MGSKQSSPLNETSSSLKGGARSVSSICSVKPTLNCTPLKTWRVRCILGNLFLSWLVSSICILPVSSMRQALPLSLFHRMQMLSTIFLGIQLPSLYSIIQDRCQTMNYLIVQNYSLSFILQSCTGPSYFTLGQLRLQSLLPLGVTEQLQLLFLVGFLSLYLLATLRLSSCLRRLIWFYSWFQSATSASSCLLAYEISSSSSQWVSTSQSLFTRSASLVKHSSLLTISILIICCCSFTSWLLRACCRLMLSC